MDQVRPDRHLQLAGGSEAQHKPQHCHQCQGNIPVLQHLQAASCQQRQKESHRCCQKNVGEVLIMS